MKKRFSQLLFIATVASLAFSSCSKDNDTLTDDSNNTEIRLSSGITTHLRSSLQNTQIVAGQKVGFFVIDPTASTIPYSNIELTGDGSGALNYTIPAKMYYPTNGNQVDFVAYHPYSSSITDHTVNQKFSVAADQTAQDDYLNSDMLYATETGVARTNTTIPLQFKHAFSKLIFTVKKGNGASLEGLSAIEVLNVLNSANVTLTTGALTPTGTAASVKAFNVPTGTATDTELTGAAAIVIPQSIAANTSLLTITIGGVDYTYTTPTGGHTFDAGKAYNIIITVNMAGITVSSEIVDWADGGSIEGDGSID